MTKKMCLRQFIIPEKIINLEGVGDCFKCIPDKENEKCKLYSPINITVIEIKNKD